MATTQILADQFDLSNDELLNGLPLIDMSKTNFWPICPLLVRQNIKCEITRFRTFTGHCNNLKHPTWGAAMTPFARYLPPIHPDGIWIPRKSVIAENPMQSHRHSPSISHPLFITDHMYQADPISNTIHSMLNHLDERNPVDDSPFAASVQFIRHAHPSEPDSGFIQDGSSSASRTSNKLDDLSGESLIDAHYRRLKASSARAGALPLINDDREHQATQATIIEPRRSQPTPQDLPPVRLISSVVHRDVDLPNHDLSILFMSWGQLLDHDMTRAAQPPSSEYNDLFRTSNRNSNVNLEFYLSQKVSNAVVTTNRNTNSAYQSECLRTTHFIANSTSDA